MRPREYGRCEWENTYGWKLSIDVINEQAAELCQVLGLRSKRSVSISSGGRVLQDCDMKATEEESAVGTHSVHGRSIQQ